MLVSLYCVWALTHLDMAQEGFIIGDYCFFPFALVACHRNMFQKHSSCQYTKWLIKGPDLHFKAFSFYSH